MTRLVLIAVLLLTIPASVWAAECGWLLLMPPLAPGLRQSQARTHANSDMSFALDFSSTLC
jgi:hypothetical protein